MELLAERQQQRTKREDRRAGEIIAILYNINRDSEKDPKGIEWRDVFPEWKEPEEEKEQTEEEMFEVMQSLVKSTGGFEPSI